MKHEQLWTDICDATYMQVVSMILTGAIGAAGEERQRLCHVSGDLRPGTNFLRLRRGGSHLLPYRSYSLLFVPHVFHLRSHKTPVVAAAAMSTIDLSFKIWRTC
jgi:hypothetical protein